MQIRFQQNFKSYKASDVFDLEDFSVITGINGSGKSQLLEALRNQLAQVVSGQPLKIAYFDASSFKNEAEAPVAGHQQPGYDNAWQILQSMRADGRWIELSQIKSYLGEDYPELSRRLIATGDSFAAYLRAKGIPHYDAWLDKYLGQHDDASYQALYSMARKLPISLEHCDRRDFDRYVFSSNGGMGLIPNLTSLIWQYYVSFRNNQVNRYLKAEGDQKIISYSDEEFEKMNGPRPWHVIDELMFSYGLRYKTNSPEGRPVTDQYVLKLIDSKLGSEVSLDALSSGEKTLLALAGAAYRGGTESKFPDLVLLDEVDAYLHPSMIKSMFTVINRVFVTRRARVILVTHSPTTVIMAPEASLHVVDVFSVPRIRKCSSQQALDLLGTGLPLLSVSMLDRRIVFTESEYDAEFYQKLYTIVSARLNSEISLVFVASGLGGKSANSDEVLRISNSLLDNKLSNIFGIIDYDDKNKPTANVKVLAEKIAYTLENVLLDPIGVAIYLRMVDKIDSRFLGLDSADSISDFANFSQEKLQAVADHVLTLYKQPNLIAGERVKWHYVNGRYIELPTLFLTKPGHPIVESVAMVPELQAIFAGNKADPLQKKIPRVFLEYPGFIPVVLTDLMSSLAPAREVATVHA